MPKIVNETQILQCSNTTHFLPSLQNEQVVTVAIVFVILCEPAGMPVPFW